MNMFVHIHQKAGAVSLSCNVHCEKSLKLGLVTSLSRKKQEKEKKRERLAILGMLINIHEQSSLASIFKNDGVVVNCFIEA